VKEAERGMLMNDISIMVRHMRTFAERRLSAAGIGFPEQCVVMYLAGEGDVNQEHIARFFELDKGAVAKTVAKLEEKGLVVRTTNPADRREKLISLTPSGRALIAMMRDVYREWHAGVFGGLSEVQVQEFAVTLAAVASNSIKLIHGEA